MFPVKTAGISAPNYSSNATCGRPPKNPSYKISPDDLLFNLVFFSTFEELNLPIHGPMEDTEVLKLY